MANPTGFLEFQRVTVPDRPPLERIADFAPLHDALHERERSRQAGRCMDCGIPFCQSGLILEGERFGCPLHNLIPEWNEMLWQHNPAQALSRLLKTNPFPEFTGRVCPAFCEAACICGRIGEAVTVRDNELHLIEYAFENSLMQPKPPAARSDKRIAVVGSGPAGLSAAHHLNRRGHNVTVFEREKSIGGLLSYGIPEMKLPKAIVRRRAELMKAEGILFRTETEISDFSALEFDCILLCCGAGKPRPLAYEGTAQGVCFATDYLRDAARFCLGEIPAPLLDAAGRRVVIVGAGDTASDCLATAIRQGCTAATQLIRKPAAYYPAALDYAHEEAQAYFGADIRRFETTLHAVDADENGALTAVLTGDGQRLDADLLLLATGFSGNNDYVNQFGEDSKIFAAGDMALGAGFVASAIADGRRCAADADRYLTGYTSIL